MLSFLALPGRGTRVADGTVDVPASAVNFQGWRDVTSVCNTATTLRARTASVDARARDAARSTRKNKRG